MSITSTIVTVTASVTSAPVPTNLQQKGVAISVGGTTLSTNASQYLTQASDLTPILSATGNYAELVKEVDTFFAQSTGTGQGSPIGIYVVELGTQTSVDAGVSALQTWINTNPNTFYSYLVPDTWDTIPASAAPTLATVASGALPAQTYHVSVAYTTNTSPNLIVGAQSPETILSVASSHVITVTSPAAFTGADHYIVIAGNTASGKTVQTTDPIAIGTDWTEPTSGLITGASPPLTLAELAADYSSPTGKQYFFVDAAEVNLPAYTSKAVVATVPSPSAQSSEFQSAALFYQWLVNAPSASNQAAPMSFRFLYGVTPWDQNATGNQTKIDSILSAYGNVILTAAEGGISTASLFRGTAMDGKALMFWYAADWVQINAKQNLAAAIINGSNSNPPLYYNQPGINSLLAVLNQLGTSAVSFGLCQTVVFTSIPFATYVLQNPNDYADGNYSGFACVESWQNGFQTISFSLDATQFAI